MLVCVYISHISHGPHFFMPHNSALYIAVTCTSQVEGNAYTPNQGPVVEAVATNTSEGNEAFSGFDFWIKQKLTQAADSGMIYPIKISFISIR